MASVALGLVGGFLFGPAGYLVGSFLGSLLDPPKQEGPRLQSLKLQVSQYGDMVKDVWGTIRIAGNVIWIGNGGNLVEHKNTSGGKGGPQVTTYTYTASFAVALANRPPTRDSAILGVLQIYADNRLIWGRGVSDDSAIPITIYLGDETQGADPTMEADLGAGNVPGFRGTAYVVFKDWDLSQFFNRIPNLEFVVYTSAGTIPIRVSSFSVTGENPAGAVSGVTFDPLTNVIRVASYPLGGANTGYHVRRFTFPDGTPTGTDIDATIDNGVVDAWISNMDAAMIEPSSGGVSWYQGGVGAQTIGGMAGFPPTTSIGVAALDASGNGFVYTPYDGGGGLNGVQRFPVIENAIQGLTDASYPLSAGSVTTLNTGTDGSVWGFDDGRGKVYHWNADLSLVNVYDIATNFPSIGPYFYTGGSFFFYAPLNLLVANVEEPPVPTTRMNLLTVSAGGVSLYPQPRGVSNEPLFSWAGGQIVYLANGYVLGKDGIALLEPPIEGVLLSDIVTDISEQCGLSSDQIDVSELTDVVDGFVIDSQMTGRNRLDPTRNAYFYDAVESDGKVKFPKRGRASIVTIPDNELAAFIVGTTPPPQLQNDRTQELDLPQQLTVDYINVGADYQPGAQVAQRQVTQSQSQVSMQLPIAMSDAKALQVANVVLDSAWAEREKYTLLLPRKYAYVDPSDVVTAKGRDIRLVTREETGTTTIKFEGVQEFEAIYTQALVSVPATGMPPATPPASNAVTDLLLLDLPLVADSDTPGSGFYSAMGPDGGGPWPGATLMRSIDSGVSYSALLVDKQADTLGTTSDALGLWDPHNNIFDEVNSVTVVLSAGGTLSGASESAVLNGANMVAIGSEIIQFKNATLIADSTYTLSGLLRGQRGTEWAIAGHGIGDKFALLPVNRADVPVSELNQLRQYKGVTAGQAVAAVSEQPFVNTGMGLRCYAPVQLGGGIDASGNATLTCVRRTRIGGDWAPFVDVPLSEPTEQYVWQVWNADYTQVARIIITSAPTAAYSVANQVTDFGAAQANIFFSVAQVGSIGIGVQANGSIVGSGGSNNDPLSPIPPYQSPTSGAPSAPPPPGSLVLSMGWANVRKLSSSAGTFACSHIVVASFTTPSGHADGVLGWISAVEWVDARCARYASLSTVAGDFSPSALARVKSQDPTIFFSVGTNGDGYPQLSPSTTYYFNVANSDGFGVCTCMTGSCGIAVELTKPTGL